MNVREHEFATWWLNQKVLICLYFAITNANQTDRAGAVARIVGSFEVYGKKCGITHPTPLPETSKNTKMLFGA